MGLGRCGSWTSFVGFPMLSCMDELFCLGRCGSSTSFVGFPMLSCMDEVSYMDEVFYLGRCGFVDGYAWESCEISHKS